RWPARGATIAEHKAKLGTAGQANLKKRVLFLDIAQSRQGMRFQHRVMIGLTHQSDVALYLRDQFIDKIAEGSADVLADSAGKIKRLVTANFSIRRLVSV